MSEFSDLTKPGTVIAVRVTPNARRQEIARQDGLIAIRVSEPPEDGKATEAARVALAKALGVAKSRLTLLRGATTREKLFRLD